MTIKVLIPVLLSFSLSLPSQTTTLRLRAKSYPHPSLHNVPEVQPSPTSVSDSSVVGAVGKGDKAENALVSSIDDKNSENGNMSTVAKSDLECSELSAPTWFKTEKNKGLTSRYKLHQFLTRHQAEKMVLISDGLIWIEDGFRNNDFRNKYMTNQSANLEKQREFNFVACLENYNMLVPTNILNYMDIATLATVGQSCKWWNLLTKTLLNNLSKQIREIVMLMIKTQIGFSVLRKMLFFALFPDFDTASPSQDLREYESSDDETADNIFSNVSRDMISLIFPLYKKLSAAHKALPVRDIGIDCTCLYMPKFDTWFRRPAQDYTARQRQRRYGDIIKAVTYGCGKYRSFGDSSAGNDSPRNSMRSPRNTGQDSPNVNARPSLRLLDEQSRRNSSPGVPLLSEKQLQSFDNSLTADDKVWAMAHFQNTFYCNFKTSEFFEQKLLSDLQLLTSKIRSLNGIMAKQADCRGGVRNAAIITRYTRRVFDKVMEELEAWRAELLSDDLIVGRSAGEVFGKVAAIFDPERKDI